MPDKRFVSKLNLQKLLLKNIGFLRFFPFIIINIIVPLLILINLLNPKNLESNMLIITQYFLPLASAWLSLFAMKEFIEADGREIYYMAGKLNILKEILKLFIISVIDILIILIVCIIFVPALSIEIVRIVSACIFYFSLTYFVSMLGKSTSITLLILILYTLVNVILKSHIIRFPLYCSTNIISYSDVLKLCLPLLITSVILIIFGKIFEKRINIFD
ncbi:MAG: hypothetical protein HFJ99_03115 [Eubacterium sp.]|nr:hypothetical protein [Eubacterium sp.]